MSTSLGAFCGQTSVYRQIVSFAGFGINPVTDTIIMARFRPVYADAKFYVDTQGTTLPLQGRLVQSEGKTGSGVTRKVVVSSQFRSPGSIFDAALYSQGNIIK